MRMVSSDCPIAWCPPIVRLDRLERLETTNDTVTVGNIGQLSGSRLKFDPAEADEGLYFTADAGGETKVTAVQKNKPAHLVFLIPTLAAGTFHLEVRARTGIGTSARELRVGRLDAPLTVPVR